MTTSTTVRIIRRAVLWGGLALFAIWTLFPLYWIIGTSFKPNSEIYGDASLWPHSFTLVHFGEIFNQTRFGTYFKNSLLVSCLTTICAMTIGVLVVTSGPPPRASAWSGSRSRR